MINVGDVVQTTQYARENYPGAKMRIVEIQTDVEPHLTQYTGPRVKSDGKDSKTILTCTIDQICGEA